MYGVALGYGLIRELIAALRVSTIYWRVLVCMVSVGPCIVCCSLVLLACIGVYGVLLLVMG